MRQRFCSTGRRHERRIPAIGQLIAFGLDPALSPGRSGDYQELVTRFRSDPTSGNGSSWSPAGKVSTSSDCSPVYGLVLAAKGTDSPYYMRLDDYAAMSAEERHVNAFVFLAIATACYPTADALDADDGPAPQITVSQVLRLMNRTAERIRERAEDRDPPVAEPQVEPLYRMVLRWREGDTTGDERSNPHVKSGWSAARLNGLRPTVSLTRSAPRRTLSASEAASACM